MTTSTRWKNSPLGRIPSDWMVERGEQLAEKITKGASPNWQGFSYVDDGILFVTSENVRDGYLDVSNPKFVESGFNEKQKNSTLSRGDVLINLVGASIGRSCRFFTDLSFVANINQAVCLFRPNCRSNPDYLHQFLQAPSTIRRLVGSQADGARPNISLSDIRTFYFLLPPVPEQMKIGTILSTWDRAIELTEKLIAAKQKRKQALMQQLLAGKGVKLAPLSAFLTPTKYAVPKPNEPYRALGIRSHCKGTFQRLVEDPDSVAMDTLYEVKQSELIVNITFAWEGAIAIVKPEDEGCLVSHRFPTYSVDPKKADIDFIRHLLTMPSFIFQLGFISPGGAGRNRVLSKTDFLKLRVKLPSIGEQTRIGTILMTSARELTLLAERLDSLKRQKKGLMQQLLTGKVRVKVDSES